MEEREEPRNCSSHHAAAVLDGNSSELRLVLAVLFYGQRGYEHEDLRKAWPQALLGWLRYVVDAQILWIGYLVSEPEPYNRHEMMLRLVETAFVERPCYGRGQMIGV